MPVLHAFMVSMALIQSEATPATEPTTEETQDQGNAPRSVCVQLMGKPVTPKGFPDINFSCENVDEDDPQTLQLIQDINAGVVIEIEDSLKERCHMRSILGGAIQWCAGPKGPSAEAESEEASGNN